MPKLTLKEIQTAQRAVPHWKKIDEGIGRTFQFKDFPAAISFVNAVSRLAEESWHHPNIDIRWNKVSLFLTTHDEGGLTDKDFNMAVQFDRLVEDESA